MNKQFILSTFVVALLIFSGLTLLGTDTIQNGSTGSATPDAPSLTLYNVTFVASGLVNVFPGSTTWNVYVDNGTGIVPVNPAGNVGYILLPSGTYTYEADSYFQAIFENTGINVNSNVTFYVNFSSPQKVVFSTPAMNSQSMWGVNIQPSLSATNVYSPAEFVQGGQNVTYYAIPGTYSYNWYDSFGGQNVTLGSSEMVLGSSDVSIRLPTSSFSNITFTETGLSVGTNWYVIQTDGPFVNNMQNHSTGNSLQLSEVAGLNTFVVGYISDNVYVNVTKITVDVGLTGVAKIAFPALTLLNVSVSNLPPSANYIAWGMTAQFFYGGLNSTLFVPANANNYIAILVPSSTFAIRPAIQMSGLTGGSGFGYVVNYTTTYVAVSGSVVNEAITLPNLEPVSITPIGLPSGATWSLTSTSSGISEYIDNGTGPSTAHLMAVNGTYSFDLVVSTPVSETVPVNINVGSGSTNFYIYLYNTTFPSPYSSLLGVNVYSMTDFSSITSLRSPTSGAAVNLYLPNGTYLYQNNEYIPTSVMNNLFASAEGTVTVSGANQTVNQGFPTQFYSKNIVITGLPSGANWQLEINSLNSSIYGSLVGTGNESVTVQLPATNYTIEAPFTVSYNGYYYVNTTNFEVSPSAPYSLTLNFSPYIYAEFVESGLPAGTGWSVTSGNTTLSSNTGQLYVKHYFGTLGTPLNYTVGNVPGYTSDPQAGSLSYSVFAPSEIVVPITFTPSMLIGTPAMITTFDTGANILYKGPYLGNNYNYAADSVAFDGALGTTYIVYGSGNSMDSGIKVLNSSTLSLIKDIPLPDSSTPLKVLVDQASGLLYVSFNWQNGYYIGVMNLATYNLQLTPFPSGENIYDMITGPSNGLLYVAAQNGVYALNLSTLATVYFIPLSTTAGQTGPYTLVYSQTSNMIYATGYWYSAIYSINPETNTLASNYTIPGQQGVYFTPGGAAIDAATGILYFEFTTVSISPSSYGNTYLGAFNTATGTFQSPTYIGLGWNYNITYDASTGMMYIPLQLYGNMNATFGAMGVGILKEFSISSGKVVNTFETGLVPNQVSFNEKTGNVFVMNSGSGDVSIITPSVYGYISGTVDSSLATVLIDGIHVPVTGGAFSASLSPGTYYVTAFDPNQAPIQSTVVVTAYSTTSISLNVSQQPSAYEVTGMVTPGTADVTFNGISAYVDSSGTYNLNLPHGTYTLSAYLNGYFPVSEQVNINGNTVINISLTKEPVPTDIITANNVTFEGFNVTATNLTSGNGNISVNFTSPGNGILTIEVPYVDLTNTNLTQILHSRVYINGVQYTDFTVSVSSNYTVILKVAGLKADPHLEWAYSSAVVVKSPAGSFLSQYGLYIAITAAAVVAVILVVSIYQRRKNKH